MNIHILIYFQIYSFPIEKYLGLYFGGRDDSNTNRKIQKIQPELEKFKVNPISAHPTTTTTTTTK